MNSSVLSSNNASRWIRDMHKKTDLNLISPENFSPVKSYEYSEVPKMPSIKQSFFPVLQSRAVGMTWKP